MTLVRNTAISTFSVALSQHLKKYIPPFSSWLRTRFLTTGDPAAAAALANRFFGTALRFRKV